MKIPTKRPGLQQTYFTILQTSGLHLSFSSICTTHGDLQVQNLASERTA